MNRLSPLLLTFAALSATELCAQVLPETSSTSTVVLPDASSRAAAPDGDRAWSELNARRPLPPDARLRHGADIDVDERQTRIRRQAEHAQKISQAARDFYNRFPGHSKAGEARKLEVVSAIQGITDGDARQEQIAKALAKSFLDARVLPAADRFEVALALERYEQSARIKAKTVKDEPDEWLKIGGRLRAEYGDWPALQSYYLDIARRSDSATAARIAADVARSSVASAQVQAEAQTIAQRQSLLGKPLPIRIATSTGADLNLAQQKKPTALIVWSVKAPDSLNALKTLKGSVPPEVELVYVAFDGSREQIAASSAIAPLPGIYGYVPAGTERKNVAGALNLRFAPAPHVYVLDRDGKVAGTGRLQDLPALCRRALQ